MIQDLCSISFLLTGGGARHLPCSAVALFLLVGSPANRDFVALSDSSFIVKAEEDIIPIKYPPRWEKWSIFLIPRIKLTNSPTTKTASTILASNGPQSSSISLSSSSTLNLLLGHVSKALFIQSQVAYSDGGTKQSQAAQMAVTAPLHPSVQVIRLLERTSRRREAHDAKTPPAR